MQKIILDKPYQFFPPCKGTFMAKALARCLPSYLRRKYRIDKVSFQGMENLQTSLAAGYGTLLTPNHSRPCDPAVMGMLSRETGQPFYYMASWHLFMESKIQTWIIRHYGAFSVYREGADRSAIRAATEILVEGERPLVIFPEGFVTRTNALVRPFMEGTSLIAQMAAKQRAKISKLKPVIVHPVAIKYTLLTNVEDSLNQVLDEIEKKFYWKQRKMPLVDRIGKVGEALLALKELEFFNEVKNGEISERIEGLIRHLLSNVEDRWLKGKHHVNLMEQVNALRHAILEKILSGNLSSEEPAACWDDLADIYLAVQLSCYPPHYLGENPTPEKLTETVERFEEDTTDSARIHGRWQAAILVEQGIEVGPEKEGKLNEVLQKKVQEMISFFQERKSLERS